MRHMSSILKLETQSHGSCLGSPEPPRRPGHGATLRPRCLGRTGAPMREFGPNGIFGKVSYKTSLSCQGSAFSETPNSQTEAQPGPRRAGTERRPLAMEVCRLSAPFEPTSGLGRASPCHCAALLSMSGARVMCSGSQILYAYKCVACGCFFRAQRSPGALSRVCWSALRRSRVDRDSGVRSSRSANIVRGCKGLL